jgi:acylpyruvate hydrolase
MRIVVFGPGHRVGAWYGDRVVDLNAACAGMLRDRGRAADPGAAAAERVPADLAGLIARGAAGLDDARAAVEHALGQVEAGGGTVFDVERVRLHAPCVYRPRIACAAGNYSEHTLGSARRKGVGRTAALQGLFDGSEQPDAAEVVHRTRERAVPRGFWKDFSLPKAHGDDITYPERCERFDYEGEVVAVLGAPARDVPRGKGGDYIWGISLLNDWSIRGRSSRDSLSFNLSKNFDGAASVGPCIVVGELDPAEVVVSTHVNGELRQHYRSGDMIFSHAEYIEYLSRDLTLLPGDMISGGSGPGTATDAVRARDGGPPMSIEEQAALFLSVGDVVEVTAPGIGTLRNRIVVKSA